MLVKAWLKDLMQFTHSFNVSLWIKKRHVLVNTVFRNIIELTSLYDYLCVFLNMLFVSCFNPDLTGMPGTLIVTWREHVRTASIEIEKCYQCEDKHINNLETTVITFQPFSFSFRHLLKSQSSVVVFYKPVKLIKYYKESVFLLI